MGKKRIVTINDNKPEQSKPKESKKTHIAGLKGGQRIAVVEAETVLEEEQPQATETKPEKEIKTQKQDTKSKKQKHGKRYLLLRTKIDPSKNYSVSEAVKLLKETSREKRPDKAEAHFVLVKKGAKGEINLPYYQATAKKVEIASEETIKKIEEGKIDFDVLIAQPAFMPNLVKYAKILGPKGLMPNPKTGTVSERPEETAKKFNSGALSYKTEANAPLVHTVFGKADQKTEELEANLQALVAQIGTKNIKKLSISSTMGPSIKVQAS